MNGKCLHCHRLTDQRCTQCKFHVCPLHSWTQVYKPRIVVNAVVANYDEYRGVTHWTASTERIHLTELCRTCRDAAISGGVAA